MKKDIPIKKRFQRWRLHPHINFLRRLHCSNCLYVGVSAYLYCNMVLSEKYSTQWALAAVCSIVDVMGWLDHPLRLLEHQSGAKNKELCLDVSGPQTLGAFKHRIV